MNPIQTNKPVFFGNDGDVLKSGRIYIGQPNQYPISFPKTVTFQDSSGAQFEAQQPLRTNDEGRISFNGKAIIALVDGNYSLLVQDRNGVQISDGYTPFVENATDEADLSGVTQVGLLLSDIKAFDVTPGDTVRNVGKLTATDGLGADWLVVSNTGSPGDDDTLIDFANGTQGRISKQTTLSLSDYQESVVELGGDFQAGSQVKVTKIGSQVVISGVQGFFSYVAGTDLAESAAGIIPTWARPASGIRQNIYYILGSVPAAYSVRVSSVGLLSIIHERTDLSTTYSTTTSGVAPTISYNV